MFVGLSNTTSLSLRRQFNDIAGKARATKIFVRPRSLTDANRGAITGRLPLIFPAGTRCAFSNSQVDEGDAGHAVLVAALKGLRVGGVGAQHSAFSVSIANFSGSYNTTGQYASNATFNINNTTLDGFKLRLADINSGGAVAALTLRQGGVKNASVKATGLLTSAYLF
ncbi:hypothetical protein MNEG_8712 [Monoraphidium neglectum]|uniref:Uncharacterized protein n=1 Tax=Monoraphidium neglectum TaxID=145388 RepID=A0A0D2JIV8_9CHLO|nr:hypothetical protein MNEG_8712 [Monoraphidium neglectum]KIY99252.1 hypothetical protein MNEG_8712 [Monoraphidium neglectum]|eukprot:XP_013898272.1 hypothetical protein MNEG_8712 [Monoraphidium neglectum]